MRKRRGPPAFPLQPRATLEPEYEVVGAVGRQGHDRNSPAGFQAVLTDRYRLQGILERRRGAEIDDEAVILASAVGLYQNLAHGQSMRA